MRSLLLAAVVAGLAAAAPARAADLDKYLPADASLYVHITTKNLFTSPVVRKAIPMAFDKYGDQLMPFIGMAKAFNPNGPDIPEEDIKKGINELKKPETIAKGFDAAKEFGPEIVVCANPDMGPEKVLILVKCADAVTPELIEGFAPMINATGQVKLKQSKAGKTTVYELAVPQNPQPFFAAVPANGVICLSPSKDAIESAVKASASKLDPELKKLVGKRSDKDFVFVATVKGKGDARETVVGSLVLDKDITGKVTGTFGSAKEAQEKADELTNQVKQMVDGLKGLLGDQAKTLGPQLDRMKAMANDKTVTFEGTIPGGVVEKLLEKDKDK